MLTLGTLEGYGGAYCSRGQRQRQQLGHARRTALVRAAAVANPALEQPQSTPKDSYKVLKPENGDDRSKVAGISATAVASQHAAPQQQRAGLGRSLVRLPRDGIVTAEMMRSIPGAQPSEQEPYSVLSRVAYQGVPGAYSESAALKVCPSWEPLPCEQFEVAFQALSQWMAERAVLPVENSLGGSIHAVYDLLLRYRLHIVGEVSVSVNHCLMALPGTNKGSLTRVMSHPQALAQVDGYLRRMPGVIREAVDDTAGAAKSIAEQGLQNVGAVASRRAAELYGLEVLEEGIQDMKDNITRFVVLSRDPLVTTGQEGERYKTSIVFSLQEGPGQLFKAMSVFALRDINMTKIESRPMRANPIIISPEGGSGNGSGSRAFNYLFYVDFAGSLADPQSQNALRHLQEIAPFLRVLGSYPADTEM